MSITDLARMQIEKDKLAAASVVETKSESKSTTVIAESASK
jgi:hypothetical protein